MYKKELDSLLSRPNKPHAYLLYGASDFYINFYGDKIARLLSLELDGAQVQNFYFEECDIGYIEGLLSQKSLFGDKTLLRLKLDKKLDKKSCDLLLNALANNQENALIIEFFASHTRTITQYTQDSRAFATNFKSTKLSVAEVRFFEPTLSESIQILSQRCLELKIAVQTQDLRYILELQNNNLAIAFKELEKLCIGATSQETKHISSQEVQFLCEGTATFSIDELNCAIMQKKNLTKIVRAIYEEGIEEVVLIREIGRFFYQLFLFFCYIKTVGTPNTMEILGFNPPKHIVERHSSFCIRLKESDYAEIFDLLNQWHVDCISGKSPHPLTTLIKIQAMVS